MSDYIICIPSYKRAKLCQEKTLSFLHSNKIPKNRIHVYVANHEELETYLATLNKNYYGKLIQGVIGLKNQREYIQKSFPEGKPIVFLDDDISKVDFSLSGLFKGKSLDFFFKEAFRITKSEEANIWGIYPVYNPFFRKARPEITTDLRYIVGAFYGQFNVKGVCSKALQLSMDQKEDVERTILQFIQFGKVIRFNRIGFQTKYYNPDGSGLGTFEARLKPMLESSKKLFVRFPEYGYIKTRKNGMTEFVLRPLKIPISNNKIVCTKTIKNKKVEKKRNKTKKKLIQ